MKHLPFEVMMNPSKYGYEVCSHCNGYGSSFNDPPGVNRCTKCGGSGLQKKKEKTNEEAIDGDTAFSAPLKCSSR